MSKMTLRLFVAAVTLAAGIMSAAAASLPDIPNPKVAAEAPEIGRYGGRLIVAQISEPTDI